VAGLNDEQKQAVRDLLAQVAGDEARGADTPNVFVVDLDGPEWPKARAELARASRMSEDEVEAAVKAANRVMFGLPPDLADRDGAWRRVGRELSREEAVALASPDFAVRNAGAGAAKLTVAAVAALLDDLNAEPPRNGTDLEVGAAYIMALVDRVFRVGMGCGQLTTLPHNALRRFLLVDAIRNAMLTSMLRGVAKGLMLASGDWPEPEKGENTDEP
jgi:hypothetical protein